ncbi:MAG TPA: class I SAM-dependent methyltransferase [Thermodesulfobacteriota bacterium]
MFPACSGSVPAAPTSLPPALARETADIETSSEGYAGRFAGPVGRWLLAEQERATARLLAGIPGRRVLDVGGGHGQLVRPLLDRGYDVTVFGSDPVCGARLAAEPGGAGWRFEWGDLLALPYADRAFDLVVSYRLLPHVTRWEALVAELCRVADRAVLVDFPTTASLNVLTPRLFGLKKRLEGNTRPYTLFREADVERVFAASGFRLTGRAPQFTLPMVLHRTLRAPALSAAAEALCRGAGLTERYGSPVIVRMERVERRP